MAEYKELQLILVCSLLAGFSLFLMLCCCSIAILHRNEEKKQSPTTRLARHSAVIFLIHEYSTNLFNTPKANRIRYSTDLLLPRSGCSSDRSSFISSAGSSNHTSIAVELHANDGLRLNSGRQTQQNILF